MKGRKRHRLELTEKLVEAKEDPLSMDLGIKESSPNETSTAWSMELDEISGVERSSESGENKLTARGVVMEGLKGDTVEKERETKIKDRGFESKTKATQRKRTAYEGRRQVLHKRLQLEGKEYKDYDKPGYKALIRERAKDQGFEEPFQKIVM